jgi:uncharacterized protein YggE
MDKIDTIAVDVSVEETVDAVGADLLVTVRGGSLVTGRAALKKAREVRALVVDLAPHGVGDEDIGIESITTSVSSGLITKSSSATFELRIACDDLEKLGDLLGVINSQKQADMNRLDWRFPDEHEVAKQMLARAVPQAREQAELIASLLGVELLGVHDLRETQRQPPQPAPQAFSADLMGVRRRQASMSSEDLGLQVSHSKTSVLDLQVSFRIGPLAGA